MRRKTMYGDFKQQTDKIANEKIKDSATNGKHQERNWISSNRSKKQHHDDQLYESENR